jgi:biopolymer transport protein ExbD
LKPDDFNHEVVKINSLYTFLLTANSTSDQSTTDDTEIARKKMFKREMTILLDNESNLYVNGNLIDSTGFSNLLKEFITPSRDTLKSVILQTSKKTWYKDFSKTLELIKKQFQMSRDKLSMELYQQLFGELAEDKKKKIRNQIPIDIQVDDSK